LHRHKREHYAEEVLRNHANYALSFSNILSPRNPKNRQKNYQQHSKKICLKNDQIVKIPTSEVVHSQLPNK
jgi:hypothetical protein